MTDSDLSTDPTPCRPTCCVGRAGGRGDREATEFRGTARRRHVPRRVADAVAGARATGSSRAWWSASSRPPATAWAPSGSRCCAAGSRAACPRRAPAWPGTAAVAALLGLLVLTRQAIAWQQHLHRLMDMEVPAGGWYVLLGRARPGARARAGRRPPRHPLARPGCSTGSTMAAVRACRAWSGSWS